MSRWNVGDIPEWEPDEDTDPDVEIAEDTERKTTPKAKSARQRIEDLLEERKLDESY